MLHEPGNSTLRKNMCQAVFPLCYCSTISSFTNVEIQEVDFFWSNQDCQDSKSKD